MYIGSWKLEDTLVFTANTHSPTTGAEADADAVPAYRIYENESGTPILTGNMALLDDANTVGHYSEEITLAAASGFEKGKTYTVRIRGVVGGVAGVTLRTFQVEAEVDANVVSDKTGYALTQTFPSNFASLAINASGHVSRVTLTDTLTTYTNNTPQTGDAYAIVSSGTHGNAALKSLIDTVDTVVDTILADTNELQTDWTNGGRLDVIIDAILADTGTDGVVVASSSKTGYALTSGERDSIAAALLDLADGVESSITVRKFMRAAGAILAGIVSGGGTGTEVFKAIAAASGGTTRVTVTVDSSGNRSAVTLNL